MILNIHLIFLQTEVGVKKEFREMLPIIVYTETFFVSDTLWVDFFSYVWFPYFGRSPSLYFSGILYHSFLVNVFPLYSSD